MISLKIAQELKAAGLTWMPAELDYFALPDRNMDERIFVISDLLVTVDVLQGSQIVSFQGASEWALDYLVAQDVVWLPREDQLRMTLEGALIELGRSELILESGLDGCRCTIRTDEGARSFEGHDASRVYAAALLYILRRY